MKFNYCNITIPLNTGVNNVDIKLPALIEK